ncbi:MAG TPA: hypothetical protein VKS21_01875 [Spirochaetota bacterium]|nr:hypothetical protein [Spirochaetota bacterium]
MIPGFADLQINGYQGTDFSSPELTPASFYQACCKIIQTGTLVFLPTIITSPVNIYKKNLPLIAKVIEEQGLQKHIPGIHLEGPFISPRPGACGAHNKKYIRKPSASLLKQLWSLARGRIKMITIAAEKDKNGKLTAFARRKNIIVSLGHQLAQKKELQQAAARGARVLTHFGNALPNLIDRHHNPLWPGLAMDKLQVTLIGDGHHLPPDLLKTIIKVKDIKNCILVSDASPAAGFKPGRYRILGNKVILEKNGRLHNPRKNCLVGSSFMMINCANYLLQQDFINKENIEQMAWHNPLKLLGIKRTFPQKPVRFVARRNIFKVQHHS